MPRPPTNLLRLAGVVGGKGEAVTHVPTTSHDPNRNRINNSSADACDRIRLIVHDRIHSAQGNHGAQEGNGQQAHNGAVYDDPVRSTDYGGRCSPGRLRGGIKVQGDN